MRRGGWALALALSLAALAPGCEAAVHPYNTQYFYAVNDAFIFRGGREGLFKSQSEAVDEWGVVAKGIANGKSYIKFSKVHLTRPLTIANEHKYYEGGDGMVEALVFEVSDRQLIGYQPPGGAARRYCCGPDLVNATGCAPGRAIVQRRHPTDEWPHLTEIVFYANETVATSSEQAVTIDATGMYYLWFVICDPKLAGTTISGRTAWKNPSGYLPGMMSYYLPFFGCMSLAYTILASFWMALYVRSWRHIIAVQNCVTVVIFFGMLEMAVWYFDYVNFNSSGFRPYSTTVAAVLIGSVRKTLARTLLLVVSMGFGVVRPTLGGITARVGALSLAYFAGTCVLDVMTNVGSIDDLTDGARIFLVLPVAVLDAVFIMWTFTSLSKTLTQLQARRQLPKLHLYRNFTNLLAVAVLISVVWIGFEMYFKVTDSFNEAWQSDWVTGAFWHVLNLTIMIGICFLWRPTDTSVQYGWVEAGKGGGTGGTTSTAAAAETGPAGVFSIGDDEEDEPSKLS